MNSKHSQSDISHMLAPDLAPLNITLGISSSYVLDRRRWAERWRLLAPVRQQTLVFRLRIFISNYTSYLLEERGAWVISSPTTPPAVRPPPLLASARSVVLLTTEIALSGPTAVLGGLFRRKLWIFSLFSSGVINRWLMSIDAYLNLRSGALCTSLCHFCLLHRLIHLLGKEEGMFSWNSVSMEKKASFLSFFPTIRPA